MLPLEVLLKEEQEALERPVDPNEYPLNIELAEILPHFKHEPYFSVLNSKGRLIKCQETPELNGMVKSEQELLAKRERLLEEAVNKLKQKYDTDIPREIVEQYLVGFAGRVLDYARRRLPGVLLDNPDDMLRERLTGERVEDARRIAQIIVKPDIRARDIITNINYFYAQAKKE